MEYGKYMVEQVLLRRLLQPILQLKKQTLQIPHLTFGRKNMFGAINGAMSQVAQMALALLQFYVLQALDGTVRQD